jgi:hypothetical protein
MRVLEVSTLFCQCRIFLGFDLGRKQRKILYFKSKISQHIIINVGELNASIVPSTFRQDCGIIITTVVRFVKHIQ